MDLCRSLGCGEGEVIERGADGADGVDGADEAEDADGADGADGAALAARFSLSFPVIVTHSSLTLTFRWGGPWCRG